MIWEEPDPLEDFEERLVSRIVIQLLRKGYSSEEAEAEAWRRVEKTHLELLRGE